MTKTQVLNRTLHFLFGIKDRKLDKLVDDLTVTAVYIVGDVAVAVVITGFVLAYMWALFGQATELIAGYYIAINLLITLLRTIRRFGTSSWTISDLADTYLADIEDIKRRLDQIQQNM